MPQQPFVGQIMPAAFGFAPKGWAFCDGSLLSIVQNQTLFALIRTIYGGDGRSTFALPDLRGRAILGSNLTTVPVGQPSGMESVTLTRDQLPAHQHTMQASTKNGAGRLASPANNLFGTNTASVNPIFVARGGYAPTSLSDGTNVLPIGGNASHNNMQPFLVINYVIALTGIFPSRS